MFHHFYTAISKIIDKHIQIEKLSRRDLKLKANPLITVLMLKINYIKNISKLNQYIITQNLNVEI